MILKQRKIISFWLLFLLCGCSSKEERIEKQLRAENLKGEYIYRLHEEHLLSLQPPEKVFMDDYPWDKRSTGNYSFLTKEFFRCKGNPLNPVQVKEINGEQTRFYDCGGPQKHSLPIKDGKEFIYPILIEILNYLQKKTAKRVVITSGHRCPEHNSYVDCSKDNQSSKHMIGAEVAFYIQGMEEQPELVSQYIQEFFLKTPRYQGQKEYQMFQRYEKETNVSIPPWYNKEIFIKIFKKNEGRNFDNRHSYPYLSLQVRYDRDSKEKVIYSWEKANRGYYRW